MAKAVDYTGYRFGRLLVTGEVLPRKSHRRMYVTCDCGTKKEVFLTSLKTDTQSCGCFHKELVTKHGQSANTGGLYRTWCAMRARCLQPTHEFYADYGGRGVTICEAWSEFPSFEHWALTNGWVAGLTLDRTDNGLLYSPETCRWADRTAQQRNRRSQQGYTSGYVGVSWAASEGKWVAGIKINGKSVRIGGYMSEREAASARDSYIKENVLSDFTLNFESHD